MTFIYLESDTEQVKKIKVSKDTEDNTENTKINADIEFLEVLKLASETLIKANKCNLLPKHLNEIIDETKEKMDELFHKVIISKDIKLDNVLILAEAYLYLTKTTYCNLVKDIKKRYIYFAHCEDYLMKCLVLLDRNKLDRKFILTVLSAYSELADIRKLQYDNIKSKLFSQKAVHLYLRYTKEKKYPIPINAVSNTEFSYQSDPLVNLQHLHMKTLNTLISTYEICDYQIVQFDEEYNKYLLYKHNLLEIQMTTIVCYEDFTRWAENSYSLLMLFAKQERFTESRSYLAVVTFKLKAFCNRVNKVRSLSSRVKYELAKNNEFWAKYGLELLRASKERLLWDQSSTLFKRNIAQSESPKFAKKPTKLFSNLERELIAYNNQITDNYLSDHNSAKVVFVDVLRWLRNAEALYKEINIFNNKIPLYISIAYRYLTYFEQAKENRIRLHKGRICILEDNIKKSNFNNSESLKAIELILTFSTILTEQFEDDLQTIQLNEKKLKEINSSVESIITNCQLFLKELTISRQINAIIN